MRVLKKYLYPLGFAMMLFSSSAMAKLHPTNFKGVTRYFRLGEYSPTLGAVALEGLIENIRFCGSFIAAHNQNGERDYVKDRSSDPLWSLVKILFPSVNGQLGTVTSGTTNFARYVKNPKTVALLLNYAKQVEDFKGKGKISQAITEKCMEDVFNTLEGVEMDKQKFKLNVLSPLINNIRKSIELNKIGMSLYPEHTTEQVLSAFFAYQFNKQEEIWSLIQDLDDTIVDKTKPLPTQEDLLKEEDIADITSKKIFDLDDIFDLTLAALWKSSTPYKAGIDLLNNGNALFFDREKNTLIKSGHGFSDCVETAGRLILNILTYDRSTQQFNLDPIRKFVKEHSPENPSLFNNVEEFYAAQTPLLANAGDIGTRSLYNTIVADLNAVPGGRVVEYNQDGNELKSGFINFIRPYEKVFRLPLKELPTEGIENKSEWVKESYNILFSALNPAYTFHITPSLSETEEDLSGDAKVIVRSAETGEDLFSFNLMSSRLKNHTEVNQLKILRKDEQIDFTSLLQNHPNTLHEGTADESLWLLASPKLQDKINHPLYKLFSQPLADNASRIHFLKTLKKNYGRWSELKKNLPSIQLMLKNVIEDISWTDAAVVEKISPIILSMIEFPELQEPLFESVRGLEIVTSNFEKTEQILRKFKNLEYLGLGFTLDLDLGSDLSAGLLKLETFKVSLAALVEKFKKQPPPELSFTVPFEKLKNIKITKGLLLSKISGLENIPNLKILNLNNTPKLKEVEFKSPMEKLENISLHGSGISKLDGLENLPNLRFLSLAHTEELKEFKFKSPMEKLENISLDGSGISKLDGLENIPHLKSLKLSYTPGLKEVEFKGPMEKLENISLDHSGISKLDGLENVPNLRFLSLTRTAELREVEFKGPMEKLENISLDHSGISKLDGLENVPDLQFLNLTGTVGLKEVVFKSPLEKLEKISLAYSGISKLDGLENVPNLKSLHLLFTKGLEEVEFISPMEKLENISLDYSEISKFGGLRFLKKLKMLDLTGTKKLTKLRFEEENKDLVLELKLSGVKRENIEGIEYLNERNIHF